MIVPALVLLLILLVLFVVRTPTRSIVVSMTTIPERVSRHKLEKTIDSILDQTYPVDRVYVNIPRRTRKDAAYPEDMIEALKRRYPSVIFNRVEKDHGPITKLVPTLSHVRHGEWIVLVDDDTVYEKNMIAHLVDSGLDAVGYAGRLGDGLEYIMCENVQRPTACAFLETFAGVMYRAELFETFRVDDASPCVNQDDIVIGHFMERLGQQRFVIPGTFPCRHDGSGTPELRDENIDSGNGNSTCYDTLFNKK